ncbi:hypothetical protein ACF0H5_019725 [Mactra antiquata]
MVSSSPCVKDSGSIKKLRKPMIEKKRRDRMNASIEKIKTILAKTPIYGSSIIGKEKAEILELAVEHILNLQEQVNVTPVMSSYVTGYRDCARETVRYLSSKRAVSEYTLLDCNAHLNNVCDQTLRALNSRPYPVCNSTVNYPQPIRTSTPPMDFNQSLSSTSRHIYNRNVALFRTPQLPPTLSPISPPLESQRPAFSWNSLDCNLSSSGSSLPSPTNSSCSSKSFDSGISGVSLNSDSVSSVINNADVNTSNGNISAPEIKQDGHWRPW